MAFYAQLADADTLIGIWKMEEEEAELLARLPQAVSEGVEQYKATHRRLEWLSVRLLLLTLLHREESGEPLIGYLPSGAPYLLDGSKAISISHTKGYVAVMLTPPEQKPGLDIEQWGERVCKVASRFMRKDEITPSYHHSPVASLLVHWSAKEALYKALDEQEAVDFKAHLRLFPFAMAAEGEMEAQEYRSKAQRRYRMAYRLYPDFVLTWVKGPWPV